MNNGLIEELIEKGQFYLLNKQYSKAIEKFKKALGMNPNSASTLFYLGLAYEGSGYNEEAKEMYRKVLEIDPNHQEAKSHLMRF